MTHRRWHLVGIGAAVASMVALAGCSATAEGGDPSADSASGIVSLVDADAKQDIDTLLTELGEPDNGKGVKLCYVTRTLYEYWAFVKDGFEARAAELGAEFQTFDITDEAAITEQLDKAKSAVDNQGCDALLASPISATSLDSVFEPAIAKGIPAIILNDAKGTLPGTVYSGPDSLITGETAADYIAGLLPDGGEVAMVEGDPGSSNAINRGQGFKNGLEKHPNLELVASQTAKWDATKAKEIATAMLTANPDIKAFYVQNDGMAFGVAAAIEQADKTGEIILVGTDGIPQAKKEIMDGNMTATVSQKPMVEGSAGVDAALWLLAGKEVPGWIEVPAFIIDKENVDDYAEGMP
ncbi:MAG: substrate-binding domain-containing protein [Microbacterium sp.]|uniref:substrate-binding domain-containing protein n=1 Tax=Microbacterium sp. TaxID=51671 RepID=UPI0039E5FDAD